MAETPDPRSERPIAGESADLEAVRAAAKAGYEGRAGLAEVSDEVREREDRRAERERQAFKNHYLGTEPKPR